ncbi:MAG: hypothetical protein PHI12_08525 [Dehalococcoidales bacterium]|nr:hypothetical protein [Dehalococcoidales bacterium]
MGKLQDILDKFDGVTFAKSLILKQIKRKIDPFLEKWGPERCDAMILANKDFGDVIPPELVAKYAPEGKKWSFLLEKLTDDDFISILPPWFIQTVDNRGNQGTEWAGRQIKWLKGFLGE